MGPEKLGGQVGVRVPDSYENHMRNFHKLQTLGPHPRPADLESPRAHSGSLPFE